MPETSNGSLYVTGEFNLTDNINVYGELIYSSRTTKTDANRQFWTADVGARSADSIGGGFAGNGLLLAVALTDHSSSEINVDYTRAVAGITGDIGFWSWDVSYQASDNDGEYINDVILDDSHYMGQVNWALGVSCAGETTEISGRTCVDIPWSDPQFLAGDTTQEQRDFLFGVDVGNTSYKQQTLEGFITGDLVTFPAGEVGAAFGLQFQKDEIDDVPGENTLAGNSWGSTGSGRTVGEQKTTAVFAEFKVPLLEGAPGEGIEKLELTGSARYTDVNTYGSDTTYKVGVLLELAGGFSIRTSRGTSFRAPALFELYLADQTGFGGQLAIDPCLDYVSEYGAGNISQRVYENCLADGVPADYDQPGSSVLIVTSGGAGRLSAETSLAETKGIVWVSPEDTFAVSMDYYEIQIKGEVANLGGADIVDRCYTSLDFANEPLCDLFTRRTGGDTGNDYGIDQVNGGYVNISTQRVRGIDYNFTYEDDFDFGTIRFSLEHTMQIESMQQLFPDSIYNNLIKENNRPKHNGIIRLSWTSNDGDYRVNWATVYYDATDDYEYYSQPFGGTTWNGESVTRLDETPRTKYHTISAETSINDMDFIVGVANLFDDKPPIVSTSADQVGNAARYSRFDFIGRRIFANFRYNF